MSTEPYKTLNITVEDLSAYTVNIEGQDYVKLQDVEMLIQKYNYSDFANILEQLNCAGEEMAKLSKELKDL